MTYLSRSGILYLGKEVISMTDLAKFLQGNEVQSELLFHRGCAAYGAGNRDAAVAAFKKSLELVPTNHNSKAALEQLLNEPTP